LEFFETSGRNLLAAEATAGVGHHVALSVVGTERLQESGYFRAKMVQENLIKASRIPYTIVRATQFFEFMGGIAQFSTVGQKVHLPPTLAQPIAADDVAARVDEIEYCVCKGTILFLCRRILRPGSDDPSCMVRLNVAHRRASDPSRLTRVRPWT
jgi:hypothetical protein